MIENLVVAAIVAAAVAWLGLKWMPASLRTRLHLGPAPAACDGAKSTCGKPGCGGCH